MSKHEHQLIARSYGMCGNVSPDGLSLCALEPLHAATTTCGGTPVDEPATEGDRYRDVRPGQTWRHYKGGLYTVVDIATYEVTLEPVVVYRDGDGKMWVRLRSNWLEEVDDGRWYRFTRIA